MGHTYRCDECHAVFTASRRRCTVCGTAGVETDRDTCRDCGATLTATAYQRCRVCGSDDVERLTRADSAEAGSSRPPGEQ